MSTHNHLMDSPKMEQIAIIIASAISCIATIVIAIYAWLNYRLIKKINFFNTNLNVNFIWKIIL